MSLLCFLFEKIKTFLSKGYSQRQIASEMHLSLRKVNVVVQKLRAEARENLNEYVSKTLPEEMELALVRLDNIMKELHKDLDQRDLSKRDRYNAIALINQCTQLKLEILGAGVYASELGSDKQQQQQRRDNNNETNTVSN